MILDRTGKEYDPERALWKPGRRAFFFFGLGAAAVALLPDVSLARPVPPPGTIVFAELGEINGKVCTVFHWIDRRSGQKVPFFYEDFVQLKPWLDLRANLRGSAT